MIPKTFEQWCKDNGRTTPTAGSDRYWRAAYEDYRLLAFREGIMALMSKGASDGTS